MANNDRVDRFVQWARNHPILSVLIISGLSVSAISSIVQSFKSLYEELKASPPAVTVDLTYSISGDLTTMVMDAAVVNEADRPVYVKCVGLHIDEDIVENIWLTAQANNADAMQPGSQRIFHGTVSLKGRDVREVWFSVESNSQTIFQSTSLLMEFNNILQFVHNYKPPEAGVTEIVPSSISRLKSSSTPMPVSTFFSCRD